MRISTKGRYAIAACAVIAANKDGALTTAQNVAKKLSISKIYLEQVFTLLRNAKIVYAEKGASGGYRLKVAPSELSVFEILSAAEPSLFEETGDTCGDSLPSLDNSIKSTVFAPLDGAIEDVLKGIFLSDISALEDEIMFYI